MRGDDVQKLSDIDLRARSGISLGTILDGTFDLSIRETCNKIIHATMAVPEWEVEQIDAEPADV